MRGVYASSGWPVMRVRFDHRVLNWVLGWLVRRRGPLTIVVQCAHCEQWTRHHDYGTRVYSEKIVD